jgi:hypothetical protein
MKKRDKANRFYAIATVAFLAGILALSVTVWLFRPAEIDEATLCPTSRPIAGHTLVILDRSDKWNPAMGDTLTQLVENAQRDTKQYQKFTIVSLDSKLSPHPLFSICNPGQPTLLSDLYRGHRYTERDFAEHFVGAAEKVIEQVRAPDVAPTSPIVEYVHSWLGADDFDEKTPNRRIILVSDMRQNSSLYSMYRRGEGEGLTPVVQNQFGPSAKGVTFDVYFVSHGQEHNIDESQVRAEWDQAFRGVGAIYNWRQIS